MTFRCNFCNKPYVIKKESDKNGCLFFAPHLLGVDMSREYWRVACPSCSALILSGMLDHCFIRDCQQFQAFVDNAMEKHGVITNIDDGEFQVLNDNFLNEINGKYESCCGPEDFIWTVNTKK